MQNQEIAKFKDILLSQKEEMVKQIKALHDDKSRKGGALSADWPEQAVEMENDEVVDALSDQDSQKLKLINVALDKIEAGNFGSCAECGEEIESRRLQSVPYAQMCMNCMEE
jgi:DnaK suppressor protein